MSAESGRVVAVSSYWPDLCRISRHFRGWQRPLENGWRMEKKNRRALSSHDWADIWDHTPIDPPIAGFLATDPGDPLPMGGSGLQSTLGVKEPDPGLSRRVVSRESIRETMTKWC